MVYHFVNELEKNNIEKIATKFHFGNPLYVEKFIMDFEMNYHISQEINSVLRGGMCVPFHTRLGVRRLSIDIDLLTELQVDEVGKIMEKLNSALPDVTITKYNPKNPAPIPNLVTYLVEYNSCFGKPETVKVDYLCDMPLKLPTQKIKAGEEIIEFKIDYSSEILTRGALIGDKITTLALQKIGLQNPKNGTLSDDIPKQVYDIASLLKSATDKDIQESLLVFLNLTAFKVKIYDNGIFDVENILDTIHSSIPNLLSFDDQITTISEYVGIFGSFKGTYLNISQPYKKTEHITDILLVWFYVVYLKKFYEKSLSQDNVVSKIISIIKLFLEILDYGQDDKKDLREDLLNSMPVLNFNPNILNQTPVEQIFLIKEIFSN